MKKVCRMDKTNKRPYCLRKPCSYRLDGSCSGPVVAVKDYYSVYNCPDVAISLAPPPDCGQHRVWTRTPYCAILKKTSATFRARSAHPIYKSGPDWRVWGA